MANIGIFTLGREQDVNGHTVPGALATFYESGTTTLVTVYSDAALTIAHASPLEADSGGLFPAIYTSAGTLKAVITKANGAALRTIDPCPVVSGSATGASSVSFSPTVALPYTNVQAAIEGAATTAAAGFDVFGLGITGNAPSLSNLDANNIGTGFYRTTGATTGTFPTGITAASTSIVRVERETSALSYQQLIDDSGVVFHRWYSGAAWSTWVRSIIVAQASARGAIIRRNATTWESYALGTSGQVLTSNGTDAAWAAPPAAGLVRTYSTPVSLSSVTSSTGQFSGGNMPSGMKRCGFYLYGGVYSASRAGIRVRIGSSAGFIITGYAGASGGTQTNTEFIVRHTSATAIAVVAKGNLEFNSSASGDVVFDGTISESQTPSSGTGAGSILASSHGITVDRIQVTIETGTGWSAGTCVFWYEV